MVVFWRSEPLHNLTQGQWESLCDGCGKCCVHKLQDEDDDQVYYTDVACQYLDTGTARCKDYSNRLRNVPGCLNLTAQNLSECHWWLPPSCSYRRLYEGRGLPSWHPLLSGRSESVRLAGHSVAQRTVCELDVEEYDWQERVVHWITEE